MHDQELCSICLFGFLTGKWSDIGSGLFLTKIGSTRPLVREGTRALCAIPPWPSAHPYVLFETIRGLKTRRFVIWNQLAHEAWFTGVQSAIACAPEQGARLMQPTALTLAETASWFG